MQVKSCKYMLQTRENYKNIQEPSNKQDLENISQANCNCKPFVLRSYGVFNMQPKYVSKNKTPLDLSIIRFINYRKELKDPKAILSDKHCQK